MERKFRISAGAIVFHENKILLVRYNDRPGDSYLVCPGGGVNYEESMSDATVREVKEETGVEIIPVKLLCLEELYSQRKRTRMTKGWFLCKVIGGKLEKTQGAKDEGIIEARWFTMAELEKETVYPPIVMEYNWFDFVKSTWKTIYLELRYADF